MTAALAVTLTASAAASAQKIQSARGVGEKAHTPRKGSAERRAVLDGLRAGEAARARFAVYFMRVHGEWAWTDTASLDAKGAPAAEGAPALLHFENEKWRRMDLSKVPEDARDPLGAEDASARFVRNLRKTFRGVPADIFPAPGK